MLWGQMNMAGGTTTGFNDFFFFDFLFLLFCYMQHCVLIEEKNIEYRPIYWTNKCAFNVLLSLWESPSDHEIIRKIGTNNFIIMWKFDNYSCYNFKRNLQRKWQKLKCSNIQYETSTIVYRFNARKHCRKKHLFSY